MEKIIKKLWVIEKKDMRQVFLLLGAGLLSCTLVSLLCGCGSKETEPMTRQGKKPAITATVRPQVKEVLPDGSVAVPLPQARLIERRDLGSMPVFPPDASGNPGPTIAEARAAAAAAKVDPAVDPAFPPDASGNPGPTIAEALAAAAAAEVDPVVDPVFPPDASANLGPRGRRK
jgi:hypothetical protein